MRISTEQLARITDINLLFALDITKRDLAAYIGSQQCKFYKLRTKLHKAVQKHGENADTLKIKEFIDLNLGWCEKIAKNFNLFDNPVEYYPTATSADRYLDMLLDEE